MRNRWDEIYENKVINAAPARNQVHNSWLPRQSADGWYRNVMLEIMGDCYDALTAKNMLEHAGALSMMEAKMRQALPRAGTDSKQSWMYTLQRSCGVWEEGKTMIFIVILLLTVCAVGLIILATFCLSTGYMREYREEENQRLEYLLKKNFLMERDYLKTCEERFREVGCNGGFRESGIWNANFGRTAYFLYTVECYYSTCYRERR